MTQIWKEKTVVPVTVVRVPENTISQVRTKDKDGYEAVQVSAGRTKRELRTDIFGVPENAVVGGKMSVADFKEGDLVRVSGVTKGRGFQGVVKRHGFHGGPKTHGQKNRWRAPGSIGSTAPQRVVPGRKMPGHMGDARVTIKNLEVARVDAGKNELFLKGAVPGAPGGILEIVKMASKKSKIKVKI